MVIKETYNIPYEGFFWYIDNKVVAPVISEVRQYDYEFSLQDKTHQKTWDSISDNYKVNNKVVGYDYFPRGRVMVDPEYDEEGQFTGYRCMVFGDKCINNSEVKEKIIDEFNLYNIEDIDWFFSDKFSVMNHYTCHNCRK